MGKLIIILLVTVLKCYGQYLPRGQYVASVPTQDESSLAQSVFRIISNEYQNFGGQFQTSQKNTEPDVVVMIVEYQSNDKILQPPPFHYGQNSPYHDYRPAQAPLSLPSPLPPPTHLHNGEHQLGYDHSYRDQHTFQQPRAPTQPPIGYENGQYDNYGHEYYKEMNSGNYAGYYNKNPNTNPHGLPWTQLEQNYNNQEHGTNKQFFEHQKPTDHRPENYNVAGFKNKNQVNHSNQWYCNNLSQGVVGDQQHPNNGGLISGTLNPITNNPSDELSQSTGKQNSPLFNGGIISEEPKFPSFTPLNPEGTKMNFDNKKPVEEDGDFQIDVRFKTE